MKKVHLLLIFILLFSWTLTADAQDEGKKLIIGVTLHPYYSWLKNIAGDKVDIRPIVPESADPHSYQPRPVDLAKLKELNAILTNGLGHDSYIDNMLKAAGMENVPRIDPHVGMPLIPVFQASYAFESTSGKNETKVSYNSHTYIAITGAIQQINNIANQLGKMDPENAKFYKDNARIYSRRLRHLLGDAIARINKAGNDDIRIATVHDGYAYLFQELGLEVVTVIQPRHGLEPSPKQLQDTIKQIKQANANILFTELDYSKKYVDIITKETGAGLFSLSHISNGSFSAEFFEQKIKQNLDAIVNAVVTVQKEKQGE